MRLLETITALPEASGRYKSGHYTSPRASGFHFYRWPKE